MLHRVARGYIGGRFRHGPAVLGQYEFNAMDVVGCGGIDESGAGGRALATHRWTVAICSMSFELSMGGCVVTGISGAVCFVFREMRVNVGR